MSIVKLIVLFCCINGFSAIPNDYCEICINHTLCKYKTEGPSPSCKSYNSSALLTKQDITELLNKINERRNFVAMGYSKVLPQAADMKKIHWSTELATFAQRWVDQCDISIHPDKEDQCRDLENVKVGQNIGSVIGHSPGLSVKGFVEMWFIQLLDYTGSVTYYNKSRDTKTNYFTQLIWADTELVGCGKAKFYVDERKLILERLVCNFAPKGNIHGKPVYSIGYPGTQCKDKMMPDETYKGLCDYKEDEMFTKLTTQSRPVNSLLRILNLSNDSVKHEIDPVRNIIKHTYVNSNKQRNQKTRHIISNKTYATFKRLPQLRKQMFGNNFMNISGTDRNFHYQQDRGHSHLYHGHEPPRYNYQYTTLMTNQEFRRYDFTTEPMDSNSNTNYRKFYQYGQCTRRPIQNCGSNPCSMTPDCCQQTTVCLQTCPEITCPPPIEECPTPCMPPLPEPCECTKITCTPSTTRCPCSIPCPTISRCHTPMCPGYRRADTDTFQNYDANPNVLVRSGGNKKTEINSSDLPFVNSDIHKSYKAVHDDKDLEQPHEDTTDRYSQYKLPERDYLYHSFDDNLRQKRQVEDEMTMKPFWQIENFNYKNPSLLKNMKYTTLANKKNKKSRKNTESMKWKISTEPITLKLADYNDYQPEHGTERYLSFDELMHLRKINDGYAQHDFRRKDKAKDKTTTKTATTAKDKNTTKTTTTSKEKDKDKTEKTKKSDATKDGTTTKTTKATTTTPTTTEYTANTQFERKKYCTRKLTCTWTAYTADENGDGQHRMIDTGGSRTPPGYVDGCTRTSTCTRDYMDRNKMATVPENSKTTPSGGRGTVYDADEDYCEKRSLNVQRRNSDSKQPNAIQLRYLDDTDYPIVTEVHENPIFTSYYYEERVTKTQKCDCCEKVSRKKREQSEYSRNNEEQCDRSKSSFSYGGLYYLILNKILKLDQANKLYNSGCPCNGSISSCPVFLYIFFIMFLIHFNKISSDL